MILFLMIPSFPMALYQHLGCGPSASVLQSGDSLFFGKELKYALCVLVLGFPLFALRSSARLCALCVKSGLMRMRLCRAVFIRVNPRRNFVRFAPFALLGYLLPPLRSLCCLLLKSDLVVPLLFLLSFPNLATASEPSQTPDQLKAKWSRVSQDELLKAATSGNGEAQYYLGLTEWVAAGDQADRSWALWSSNRMAQAQVAKKGVDANRARWAAVPEAEAMQAAEAGDDGAQLFIKQIEYERAQDHGLKAFEWLKRAAAQSLPPAQYEVAIRYLRLSGWVIVPSDKKQGIDLLRRAAAQGYEGAQHRLANILIEGDIQAPIDLSQGIDLSERNLLTIDLPQGIELLRKAADQGCPRAEFELAQEYACGNGDPRSDAETPVALLSKAAKAGWSDAQFTLAERYCTGFNVQTNNAKAFFWYSQAASNGVEKAFLQCNKLKSSLSADDYQQVRRLSEELKAHPK